MKKAKSPGRPAKRAPAPRRRSGDSTPGLRSELADLLEQQAATSELLKVIRRSAGDIQPALDAVVEAAGRLARADACWLRRTEGDELAETALWVADEATRAALTPQLSRQPRAPGSQSVMGLVWRERRTLHVEDIRARDDLGDSGTVFAMGGRTVLGVPLLEHGRSVGQIVLARKRVEPFTPRQIRLVEIFADEAAIAIDNVRLFNDTTRSLKRETAIADILKVIAASPSDLQPVLDGIARSAASYCAAEDVSVFLLRDRDLVPLSHHGPLTEPLTTSTDHDSVGGEAFLRAKTVHVADITAADGYPVSKRNAEITGQRAIVASPLLREGRPMGLIVLRRSEPRPFTDDQITLVETFADQAVIAIENVRLLNETKEALTQQTAVADVLKTISRSAFDLQAVLQIAVENAVRLAGAEIGWVSRVEGERFQSVAYSSSFPEDVRRDVAARGTPGHAGGPWVAIERGGVMGFTISQGHTIHVPDVRAEPDPKLQNSVVVKATGARTVLGVPMVRDGRSLGAMVLARYEVQPFSDRAIRLVETFADQAAIAIENVRLFNETKEALERQTAVADVLKTISQTTFDLQAVFDVVVENATKLCRGDFGYLFRREGDVFRLVASSGGKPEHIAYEREHPTPVGPSTLLGRVGLTGALVHIPDAFTEPGYDWPPNVEAGLRTIAAVPIRSGGAVVGAIGAGRFRVEPFSPEELRLFETFADQAGIAIENVRLFNETKEALDRQTAVAEILRAISESPTDVQPVLDKIAESALRYCGAEDATVVLVDAGQLDARAHRGPVAVTRLAREYPLDRSSVSGRSIVDRRTIEVSDLQAESSEYPYGAAMARSMGHRSIVSTPLLRGPTAIGAIVLRRTEVRPFAADQVDLVRTFADQAAIAIENVRLFNETKEALERQTGTADVMRIISASLGELQRVLDLVIAQATRLADAENGFVYQVEGDVLRMTAAFGDKAEVMREWQREHPIRKDYVGSSTGRAFSERRTVHIPDVLTDPTYTYREAQELGGFRVLLSVPMVREGVPLGVIALWRTEPRPFSEAQIKIVELFGDQALVAIENARLFNEIQDKTRQLEVASRHKSEFLANMSHELRTPLNAIIGFTDVMLQEMFGPLNDKQKEYLEDVRGSGTHLLTLINDILDLSKIEAGRVELEPTEFSLAEAITNALTLVRERAARHGITLTAEISPDVGPVLADERKVKQVVVNLLTNAVKFTPDGGRVSVAARCDGERVEVAVSDSGIGIAPEDHARVFEEFQQVGKDPERSREGTGLGLTLSKRFVELHGGRIWCESEVGQGSTFTFTIPVRQTAAAPVGA